MRIEIGGSIEMCKSVFEADNECRSLSFYSSMKINALFNRILLYYVQLSKYAQSVKEWVEHFCGIAF